MTRSTGYAFCLIFSALLMQSAEPQSSFHLYTNEDGRIIAKNFYKVFDLDMEDLLKRQWFDLMARRPPVEMTDSIDAEVCDLFQKSPSVELAGMLGLCRSERSRELLFAYKPDASEQWDGMVNLARARRGDTNAMSLAVCNLTNGLAKAKLHSEPYVALARVVSYIGNAECVVPYLDTISGLARRAEKNEQIAQIIRQTLRQSEPFFAALDCPELPKERLEHSVRVHAALFPAWWEQNRETVRKKLLERAASPPFLRLRYSIGVS